jgi:nucleoside-diphosphate-sugar epimerase
MDWRSKRVCITGIGGFIGMALATRLQAMGATVVGLEQSPKAAARARRAGLYALAGDVAEMAHCRDACHGANVVFHTAARVSEQGTWAEFRRPNVDGARNAAVAARDAGASHFVHLSSVMVYGFHYPPDVDEDGPQRGCGHPYCQTKIESEHEVGALHDASGLHVIICRPGDVYGVGSEPWVRRPLRFMRRKMFVLPDGGRGVLNLVHVENLVDALILSVERDYANRPFVVTDGQAVRCSEFYGALARAAGLPPPPTAPAWALRRLFGTAASAARLLGKPSPVDPAAVDFLLRPHRYGTARAEQELGHRPRVSLEQGMAELRQAIEGGQL